MNDNALTPRDPLLPLMAQGQRTRGWPKHATGARVRYHRLSYLLTADHPGDAHFAAYSVPAVERRLVTDPPAYDRIEAGVPMLAVFFDLDCAAAHRARGGSEKVRADDAWWAEQRPRIDALLLAHPGGFVFRTRGGARIVYRLPVPLVIRTGADEHAWKRLYCGLLAMLARRFDLICDAAISDWPRLHRLPRVVRDGAPQRYETIGNPHDVGAIDYASDAFDRAADLEHARSIAKSVEAWGPLVRIVEGPVTLTATRVARKPRQVTPREFSATEYTQLAEDLGRALRNHHGRHLVHRALAGACYARGVPADRGEDLARAITIVTGETDDRPQVWRTTAERLRNGRPVEGYSTLRAHWPDLARILDAALPLDGGAQATRDALDAIGTPTAVPAADAARVIRAAIDNAPLGFSVVKVTEGSGKTVAAAEVAIARARAAPPGRLLSMHRTLIVTDKHAVAERLADRLRDAGVHAEYWRSVLSVKHPDDSPACDYFVPVAALARGRQSAVATFCDGVGMGHKSDDPCPRRPICPAYQNATIRINATVDEQPRVVITVHAKLASALAWAGDSALVLIDEDPHAVEPHSFTREQLDDAAKLDHAFSGEAWRSVILRALAAGLSSAVPGENVAETLSRGVGVLSHLGEWRESADHHYQTTDPHALAERFAVRAAYRKLADGTWKRRPSFAPKLHPRERNRVFAGGALPQATADASLVHAVIAQAFAGAMKAVPAGAREHAHEAIVVVDRGDAPEAPPVLRVLISSAAMSESLRRYGQTVLLDATAHIEALEAIAGHRIECTEIRVTDGAPIDRRLLYFADGTRRKSIGTDNRTVQWDNGLRRYVTEAIAYILERAPAIALAVALFSWKPVADAFRLAWDTPSKADPVAVELLQPLRDRRATLHVGHYGATRGSDAWSDCDGYISIGDPRPNLGSSHAVAAAIGLGDERDAVYRHATAAEASQTAGRVRAPWRAKRGVHVHVGTIAPLSWDASAEVVELPQGVREVVDASQAVRVYGSRRLAGRVSGVPKSTLHDAFHRDDAGVAASDVSLSEENVDRDSTDADNGASPQENSPRRDSGMFGDAFEMDPDDEWRA